MCLLPPLISAPSDAPHCFRSDLSATRMSSCRCPHWAACHLQDHAQTLPEVGKARGIWVLSLSPAFSLIHPLTPTLSAHVLGTSSMPGPGGRRGYSSKQRCPPEPYRSPSQARVATPAMRLLQAQCLCSLSSLCCSPETAHHPSRTSTRRCPRIF